MGDITLLVVCVWIAGIFTGAYLQTADVKGKQPMHMASIVFGPLFLAILFTFVVSLLVAMVPHFSVDVLAEDIVEFFSQ